MLLKPALKKYAIRTLAGTEKLVRGKLAYTPSDLAEFRDFLFLQYMMPLGYCVHDTPIYEAMRACMPDAQITVATRGTGYETLRHNPYIDNLIVTTDPLVDTVKAAKELRAELSRRGIVPACCMTNCSNPRTRITLLNMLAGKHVRLGHTLAPELYHLPQKYDQSVSLIDNNLCLVANFGCAVEHIEPHVFFTENDLAKVRELLQARGLDYERPLTILVTQTSGGQRTGWHNARFSHVIRHISHKTQVAFAGTAAESQSIEALRSGAVTMDSLASVSLAGSTTIPELSALLCIADYVVSLDTGTMHIGRASGVPMVVLGPSWQKPLEWLPLGMEHIRILRGEDIERAPDDYQLDEIEVNHVINAFSELMSLYPASFIERSARVRKSLSVVDHGAS